MISSISRRAFQMGVGVSPTVTSSVSASSAITSAGATAPTQSIVTAATSSGSSPLSWLGGLFSGTLGWLVGLVQATFSWLSNVMDGSTHVS